MPPSSAPPATSTCTSSPTPRPEAVQLPPFRRGAQHPSSIRRLRPRPRRRSAAVRGCCSHRSPGRITSDVLAYQLLVVVVALIGGIWPALFAAVLSGMTLDFLFVEPLFTITIAEPLTLSPSRLSWSIAVLVARVDQAARRIRAATARGRESECSRPSPAACSAARMRSRRWFPAPARRSACQRRRLIVPRGGARYRRRPFADDPSETHPGGGITAALPRARRPARRMAPPIAAARCRSRAARSGPRAHRRPRPPASRCARRDRPGAHCSAVGRRHDLAGRSPPRSPQSASARDRATWRPTARTARDRGRQPRALATSSPTCSM